MAYFDNNMAVHGIIASFESFSLTKNNYNTAKIINTSQDMQVYGDTRIASQVVGSSAYLSAYGNPEDDNGHITISATNDVDIGCGTNGNFHINMAGRIKLNNVSYGTEMPSIENAKEGQIYFRIID